MLSVTLLSFCCAAAMRRDGWLVTETDTVSLGVGEQVALCFSERYWEALAPERDHRDSPPALQSGP